MVQKVAASSDRLSFLHHRVSVTSFHLLFRLPAPLGKSDDSSHILLARFVNVLWVQFQIGALSSGLGKGLGMVMPEGAAISAPGPWHTGWVAQITSGNEMRMWLCTSQFFSNPAVDVCVLDHVVRMPPSGKPSACCANTVSSPPRGCMFAHKERPHPPWAPRTVCTACQAAQAPCQPFLSAGLLS